MQKYPLVSRWKLTALAMLGAFSLNAHAEYYVVYPASAVPVYRDCGCTTRHVYTRATYHRARHHTHHQYHAATHRRSSYHMDVYYIYYAYPGEVAVPPPGAPCCCGQQYRDYWQLQSAYATSPVVYEHDDDATYYAPDLDRSTADDVDYAY